MRKRIFTFIKHRVKIANLLGRTHHKASPNLQQYYSYSSLRGSKRELYESLPNCYIIILLYHYGIMLLSPEDTLREYEPLHVCREIFPKQVYPVGVLAVN